MPKKIISIIVAALVIFIPLNICCAADDNEKYQSATEYDYPPFSVTSEGEADGFSVDLLKAVAQEVGIQIAFKIDDWSTIKYELETGELDVLPLVGYSEQRDEVFDFSVPYIVMHGNIFVNKNNKTIFFEDDLFGKEIIVMQDDNAHEYAVNMNFTDKLILTETYKEAFELLNSGKHDAVLAQNLIGVQLIEDLNLKNVEAVTQLGDDGITRVKTNLKGFEQKFCFAVKEGNSELLAKLNEGLAIVSVNGKYNELYAKWFPFLTSNKLTSMEIFQNVGIILLPVIFIMLIIFTLYTKKQLKKKKIELEEANRKKLRFEARLRDQQKLESIGTLAGGVAHEINNPVNGIMNYGQLIFDESDENSTIKEYAQEIIHETERVSEIVTNLLQFSRQEHRGFSMVKITDIIDKTLSLVKTIIRNDQIDIQVEIEENLPRIECRSQQIQQVLLNLLTNARDSLNSKYPGADADKKLILICKKVKRKNKEWVQIIVEDHGTGIEKSIQKKIFDPFYTTKDRASGTGLGLYISYGIVKDHKGRLTFETMEDSFTRFYLYLPVKEQEF